VSRITDEGDKQVVFRRIRGRIVPVRISLKQRLKEGLTGSVAPAAAASVLGELLSVGTAVAKKQSKFTLKHFAKGATLGRMGKVFALTVGFSTAYQAIAGARQKNTVIAEPRKREKDKTRILIASKPGFAPGHELGEHSYLLVRNKKGKTTVYGGQIKDASEYGSSGVKLVRNYKTDQLSLAKNVHDITPDRNKDAQRQVARITREAAILDRQLMKKDYKYRSRPILRKRYNSNSVVGTLAQRSRLDFQYSPVRHNMPGFARTIPRN